jgi:hypothetical protein
MTHIIIIFYFFIFDMSAQEEEGNPILLSLHTSSFSIIWSIYGPF